MFDPEIKSLNQKARERGIKVFIRPILVSFGLFQSTIE